MIATDEGGAFKKAVFGPVPGFLSQTPVFGEHLAVLRGLMAASQDLSIFAAKVDCAALMKGVGLNFRSIDGSASSAYVWRKVYDGDYPTLAPPKSRPT